MKPIVWEAAPGALDALLATRQFVFADLYTISLANGVAGVTQPLRFTTADIDIACNGHVWTHRGPLIGHDKNGQNATGHWKMGLDVDTWDFVVTPRTFDPITNTAFPDNIGGISWQAAARAGVFENAAIDVDQVFLPVWPKYGDVAQPTGVLNLFSGIVGPVDFSRTQVSFSLNSWLVLLGTAMPRNLYGASCKHSLFDVGCKLNRADFAVTGTVLAVDAPTTIETDVEPPAGSSGTFRLGYVGMTSGRNAGFSRPIAYWLPPNFSTGTNGGISLFQPFPFDIAVGDPLTVWPGCDKSHDTCGAFGNQLNFGGERFIPAPPVAYGV